MEEDLRDNFSMCQKSFRERVKNFFMNTENPNKIKKLNYGSKSSLSVCLPAILDDKESAFVLINLMFDAVCLICDTCGKDNEEMVISDSPKEIVPINNNQKLWDRNDLSDTYLWFSSVLELFYYQWI